MSSRPRLDGFVILSYCFPPMSNGPAFVIETLLAQLDVRKSIVYCGRPDRYSDHFDRQSRVETSVRQFDIPPNLALPDGRLRLGAAQNVLVALALVVSVARALKRSDVRGMLVVYPKQHFLLAAVLASLTTRKPLAVYFTDVYVEGLPRGRAVARLINRLVARRASVVFAMNDALAAHIRQHLDGIPVVSLPPVYEEEAERAEEVSLEGRPSIVFTGTVYSAQADAIRRLVSALDRLHGLDPRLHIISQMDPSGLAQYAIAEGPRVTIRRASRAEARAIQRAADILFLPLAFDAPELVQTTSSPSKLPEYLAAGRPILVHAPRTAYLSAYARERGFAEVVDVANPDELARGVERLATDTELRQRVVAAAEQTLEEHRAGHVAETLRASLERMLSPSPD
jgi:glycosyltransferase involved in cell wall biosynthesis